MVAFKGIINNLFTLHLLYMLGKVGSKMRLICYDHKSLRLSFLIMLVVSVQSADCTNWAVKADQQQLASHSGLSLVYSQARG